MLTEVDVTGVPNYVADVLKHALVVGGTRGIGKALVERLIGMGWNVEATGRQQFDISKPSSWETWRLTLPADLKFDLVIFSAGELTPYPWRDKLLSDMLHSYAVHAAGPVCFLSWGERQGIIPWWARVVFISTVGAINTGACDLGYGAAKAALEKTAKALKENAPWEITLIRLDLVNTRMLRQLPSETLHGRPVLEPEEAAELILSEAGIV